METWVSPITKWLLGSTAVTTSDPSSSSTTSSTDNQAANAPTGVYPDPTTLPLSQPQLIPAAVLGSKTDLHGNNNGLGQGQGQGQVQPQLDVNPCFLKETQTHAGQSHPFKVATTVRTVVGTSSSPSSPPLRSPKHDGGEQGLPANIIDSAQHTFLSNPQEQASIHPLVKKEPLSHCLLHARPAHAPGRQHDHHHHHDHQHQHQHTNSSDSSDLAETDGLSSRRLSLRGMVRALQWALSGPKASKTRKVKSSDDSDSDKDQESVDSSREMRAKHRKRKRRQSAKSMPSLPPPRPTISKTRLKVFVGTWNMMGQMPNIRDGLTGFLDLEHQKQQQQQQSSLDPNMRATPSPIPSSNLSSSAPHSQQLPSPLPPPSRPLNYSTSIPDQAMPKTGILAPEPLSTTTTNRSEEPSIDSSVTPSSSQQSTIEPEAPAPPKPKKRRASNLLKIIRHPHHGSSTDLASTPLPSTHGNNDRQIPDITSASGSAPGILKEPFLEMNARAPYHIIAINTQECEREIREAVLFPSKTSWEKQLQAALGPDYVMIKTETMAALHIAVFIWKPIEDLVSAVDSSTVATGIGGIVGNKGAVAISVYLGSTSLLFVNAHLTAHQSNTQARNSDYKRIIQELQLNEAPKRQARGWHFKGDMKLRRHYNYPPVYLPKAGGGNGNNVKASSTNNLLGRSQSPNASSSALSLVHPQQQPQGSKSTPHLEVCADVTELFDYTFWAGDLNYRVDLSRKQADECLQKGDLETMLAHDQLSIQKAAGAIFEGFTEAPIKFKPTYKFDPLLLIPTDSDNRPIRRNWTRTLHGRPLSMLHIQEPNTTIRSPASAPTGSPLYRMENSKSCPSLLLDEHALGGGGGHQSDDGDLVFESDTEGTMTDGGVSATGSGERRYRRIARGLSVSKAIKSVRHRRSAILNGATNSRHRRFPSDDVLLNGHHQNTATAAAVQSPLSATSLPCESVLQDQVRKNDGEDVMVVRPVRVQALVLDQALQDQATFCAPAGARSSSDTASGHSREQQQHQRQQQQQKQPLTLEKERQRLVQMVRYDSSSKQRIPSWTDRILWKATGGNIYLPAEIGDDTRSENGNAGGGGGRGWSLLRKSRSRVISDGPGSPKTPGAGGDEDTAAGGGGGFMLKLGKKKTKDSAVGEGGGKMSLLESLRMEFHSATSRSSHRGNNGEGPSKSPQQPCSVPLMSADDEDRAAVLVKEYTAHHDIGLFSDHRPVTAVFAVRFDWKLTDRGGVLGGGGGGGGGGGIGNGLFQTKSHRTTGERWGPLDKVLERM